MTTRALFCACQAPVAAMDGRHCGGMMFGQRSRAGFAGRRSQFERRPWTGRSESSCQWGGVERSSDDRLDVIGIEAFVGASSAGEGSAYGRERGLSFEGPRGRVGLGNVAAVGGV